MNPLIEQIQLEKCCNLIAMRTGIRIRVDERGSLRDYILAKLRTATFSNMESYFRILESDSPESRLEWKELINGIAIGESYFFRDKGQFALLENRILPELIDLRKKERTLRIWSAGCSAGEEAYSLAILVEKLIPDQHAWKILILGTDIKEESINKAENGLYGQWSFRRVESDIKSRYFRKRKDQWEIDRKIRNMVVFRTMNLIGEQFPDTGTDLHNMDLILCRNLFIYFSRMAVCKVLKKLTNTLREDGYLMTGHGELHNQELDSLKPMIFPESVIYHKGNKHPGIPIPAFLTTVMTSENHDSIIPDKPQPHFSAETVISKDSGSATQPVNQPANQNDVSNMLADMKSFFESGDYTRVIEKAESVLSIDPRNTDAAYFMARAYAGRGLYDDSLRQLNQLLRRDSDQVGVYLLLAQISEIQGDHEGAKDSLKKVIYLDPGSVAAHLELGAIYQKEKDTARATKMRTSALQLIKALPPETIFEIYDGISASELEKYVMKMLEDEKNEGADATHLC